MSNILTRDTNTITIANFWENYLLGKYNFDPEYQRKSVWSEEKQSFFIDSLLKNFPMPPIFLHQKIDDTNGKTSYDIIDGKQRLLSIVRFLQNEIPASDEFKENPFYDENIAGVYFKDLDNKELIEYKKKLWRYIIPIEYIDTSNRLLIDNIFDRLNRNGEPLNGQELRKSMYHGSKLLVLVEKMAENPFWKQRLTHVDVARMENYEFISELIFQLIQNEPLHANQSEIDQLYATYANLDLVNSDLESEFLGITSYLNSLEIKFDELKISGVSHLYGLWCFSNLCYKNSVDIEQLKTKLSDFYSELRTQTITNPIIDAYRKSMSSRTKDKSQRKKRVKALCDYTGIQ